MILRYSYRKSYTTSLRCTKCAVPSFPFVSRLRFTHVTHEPLYSTWESKNSPMDDARPIRNLGKRYIKFKKIRENSKNLDRSRYLSELAKLSLIREISSLDNWLKREFFLKKRVIIVFYLFFKSINELNNYLK